MPPQASLVPDWIVDDAEVLTTQEEYELVELLMAFYERTTVELVGVTIERLHGQPVVAFTETLFDEWDLGSRQTNNGIMVLLALEERQVHITHGSGMALQLPQNRLDSIMVAMAKRFGDGEISAGFKTGFTEIMAVAETVTWTVDYASLSAVAADSMRAAGRIVSTDAVITGFDDDHAIISDSDGISATLRLPLDTPMLAVDDLLGVHARVLRIVPLELIALSVEVDVPF